MLLTRAFLITKLKHCPALGRPHSHRVLGSGFQVQAEGPHALQQLCQPQSSLPPCLRGGGGQQPLKRELWQELCVAPCCSEESPRLGMLAHTCIPILSEAEVEG